MYCNKKIFIGTGPFEKLISLGFFSTFTFSFNWEQYTWNLQSNAFWRSSAVMPLLSSQMLVKSQEKHKIFFLSTWCFLHYVFALIFGIIGMQIPYFFVNFDWCFNTFINYVLIYLLFAFYIFFLFGWFTIRITLCVHVEFYSCESTFVIKPRFIASCMFGISIVSLAEYITNITCYINRLIWLGCPYFPTYQLFINWWGILDCL